MSIRVLLLDDETLARSGFRLILEAEGDIEVVEEAANGVEAVEAAKKLDNVRRACRRPAGVQCH